MNEPSPRRIRVMQITDTLYAGGKERVAVDLANLLPRARYESYLCTTRREGPLADLVQSDVGRLRLERKRSFDTRSLRRFLRFIRQKDIDILHAHGPSLFIAAIASYLPPFPTVVWHDHFGNYLVEERSVRLYGVATRRVGGVIAVNQPLADWARDRLGVPAERVWNLPNFVCQPAPAGVPPDLPGTADSRIVCVANFRPQKDHLNLVQAMAIVTRQIPAAHLLLVGDATDKEYYGRVQAEIARLNLGANISMLGQRRDVTDVLRACAVGVLSSASEGLPLALIEYGMVKLPAVVTDVGQCADVLEQGQSGLLVPPGAADKLAEALLSLLQSPARRAALAERFYNRVQQIYSADAVIEQVCGVYDTVLAAKKKSHVHAAK